jgi:hypothetical protein
MLPHRDRSRTTPFNHGVSRGTLIAENATSQLTSRFRSEGLAVHSDFGTSSCHRTRTRTRITVALYLVYRPANGLMHPVVPTYQFCSQKLLILDVVLRSVSQSPSASPLMQAASTLMMSMLHVIRKCCCLFACSPAHCAAPSTYAAPLPLAHECPQRSPGLR